MLLDHRHLLKGVQKPVESNLVFVRLIERDHYSICFSDDELPVDQTEEPRVTA